MPMNGIELRGRRLCQVDLPIPHTSSFGAQQAAHHIEQSRFPFARDARNRNHRRGWYNHAQTIEWTHRGVGGEFLYDIGKL